MKLFPVRCSFTANPSWIPAFAGMTAVECGMTAVEGGVMGKRSASMTALAVFGKIGTFAFLFLPWNLEPGT